MVSVSTSLGGVQAEVSEAHNQGCKAVKSLRAFRDVANLKQE